MEEVALHSKKTEIQTQCLQLAPLQNMYKNPIKQPFHVKKMLELKNSKSQQNSLWFDIFEEMKCLAAVGSQRR